MNIPKYTKSTDSDAVDYTTLRTKTETFFSCTFSD